jgi:hypothetical protein
MLGRCKYGWPLWNFLLLSTWWTCPPFFGRDVLNGQTLGSRNLPCPPSFWREIADFEGAGERAVPVLSPETGTAPIRLSSIDSLELAMLDIDIQKAEERVRETSFWKRIIPQVHISGSFGVRDVVFIDPTTFTPYILPRDAYRLTISLSLNEAFNFSKHSLAEFELARLSTERAHRLQRQAQLRNSFEQQLIALQEQLGILQEEMSIVQDLLRFNQMRFEQGEIEFDSLMRTKLELLNTQKAIQRIHHQQSELRLKLSQGDVQ